MKAKLRLANINDKELLAIWDQTEHVQFASGNDAREAIEDGYWDHELSLCNGGNYQYYIGQIDGSDIACVLIINPATEVTHYWGEIDDGYRAIDIWIGDEKNIGLGYGTAIMKEVFRLCFGDKDCKGVLIDPLAVNVRAIKFYQKLGFKFLENRNFGEDCCDVYILKREDWE